MQRQSAPPRALHRASLYMMLCAPISELLRFVCDEGRRKNAGAVKGESHGPNNFKDSKSKMSSLLVFNRVYRLESKDTVSHVVIFDPLLWTSAPLTSHWLSSPLHPSLCTGVCILIVCNRGAGRDQVVWRASAGVIHCDQIPNLRNCFTTPNIILGPLADKHTPLSPFTDRLLRNAKLGLESISYLVHEESGGRDRSLFRSSCKQKNNLSNNKGT